MLQVKGKPKVNKINKKNKTNIFIKKNISGWLIMIPAIILFIFFVWEPLIENIRLSFYSARGITTVDFVGLQNYRDVFKDPAFIPAIKNTMAYTIWSLVLGFLVPIVMAILINEMVYAKGLFRIGTYFPNVVPGLATVMMWGFIFRPGETGILNIILHQFGVEPQVWLNDPKLTIPLIVITMTWRSAGATALIYLACLQGINHELYEAAIIDGASIWNRIVHVTIPNMKNLGRTLLILQVVAVFQVLYEPMVMKNGGPNNASISIMELVYNLAFGKFDFPKAAAISVMMSIFLITVTVIYNKFVKAEDM
ncbi:carbohydrate ABC transporter permease [Clostridium sp. YIM B02551]|uniref:carbohydrate ABC transporter permease n=1 Tax=Clostridium sp. YIM B02551 TaxID=2910679 RepID=UPI001EEA142A|nr:sugar ABC transporter permease [Clostridium sp. YIM B02551]